MLESTTTSETNNDIDVARWESEGGAVLRDDSDVFPVSLTVDVRRKEQGNCSLNRKAQVAAKPIYPMLSTHQSGESNWDYHGAAALLNCWYQRFNERFRLQLPQVPLRMESRMKRNCAGYFRPGYNEFGLVYEIAVAVPPPDELASLDVGEFLGTLLHEQLHFLQELTGVPGRNNYHNLEYRATAERFGLLVDGRGHQTYSESSVFLDLLDEFKIDAPRPVQVMRAVAKGLPIPTGEKLKRPSRAKIRKWSCGCTNVWVGVAQLGARCTRPDCGKDYALADCSTRPT